MSRTPRSAFSWHCPLYVHDSFLPLIAGFLVLPLESVQGGRRRAKGSVEGKEGVREGKEGMSLSTASPHDLQKGATHHK